jgi:hypothetical protein
MLCNTFLLLSSLFTTPNFFARLPMSQNTAQKEIEIIGVMIAKDP